RPLEWMAPQEMVQAEPWKRPGQLSVASVPSAHTPSGREQPHGTAVMKSGSACPSTWSGAFTGGAGQAAAAGKGFADWEGTAEAVKRSTSATRSKDLRIAFLLVCRG